jgi:3-deoxy-D-manno-octulosonic-acid transferase
MLLYNLLSTTAALLYSPLILLKKGPEPRRDFIFERFGLSAYDRADIWIHAVSVGEVLAGVPFLKTLRRDHPSLRIVLSTTTYTGQKVARQHFPEADRIMYMPVDSILCVRRVVRSIRPGLFITIETELWPALFRELKNAGSRIMIVNGRLSPGSFKGYSRISFFMKHVLSMVDSILMQGEADAERIIAIGASPDKVEVMGNLKFDMNPGNASPADWIEGLQGEIFLAASTHRGEDEIILDAYDMIRKKRQGVRLIIAPRHPERFDEVYDLIRSSGYECARRTAFRREADVVLLDTVGELFGLFSRADVAFIGGSLVPTGGHNILEPAYWGKPILFGPHMENFPIALDFLAQGAAVQVNDAREISGAVIDLLSNREKASGMGMNAKDIVEKNRGAVKTASEAVRRLIGTA